MNTAQAGPAYVRPEHIRTNLMDVRMSGKQFFYWIHSVNPDGDELIAYINNEHVTKEYLESLTKDGNNIWHTLIVWIDESTIEKMYEVMKALSQKGVNINAQNSEGRTALHLACKHIHGQNKEEHVLRLVNFLLDKGAEVNTLDINGESALDLAIENKCYGAANALVARQAPFLTQTLTKMRLFRIANKVPQHLIFSMEQLRYPKNRSLPPLSSIVPRHSLYDLSKAASTAQRAPQHPPTRQLPTLQFSLPRVQMDFSTCTDISRSDRSPSEGTSEDMDIDPDYGFDKRQGITEEDSEEVDAETEGLINLVPSRFERRFYRREDEAEQVGENSELPGCPEIHKKQKAVRLPRSLFEKAMLDSCLGDRTRLAVERLETPEGTDIDSLNRSTFEYMMFDSCLDKKNRNRRDSDAENVMPQPFVGTLYANDEDRDDQMMGHVEPPTSLMLLQ